LAQHDRLTELQYVAKYMESEVVTRHRDCELILSSSPLSKGNEGAY